MLKQTTMTPFRTCLLLLALILIHTLIIIYNGQSSSDREETKKISSYSHRSETNSLDISHIEDIRKNIFNYSLIDRYLYDMESFDSGYSLSEITKLYSTTRFHVIPYTDLRIHKYDTLKDLEGAFGPDTNQELCLKELESLNKRALNQTEHKLSSTDINFFDIMNTFGNTYVGFSSDFTTNVGQYRECLKLKIDAESGSIPTRFCFAIIKQENQPIEFNLDPSIGFKAGVCLPKICDSLEYKNKYQLILNLVKFNMRRFERDTSIIASLYCLPDEVSPSRSLWSSTGTITMILLLSIWLTFLAYSTFKCEILMKQLNEIDVKVKQAKLTSGSSVMNSYEKRRKQTRTQLEFYGTFCITRNFKQLFNTTKKSSITIFFDRSTNSHKNEDSEPIVVDFSVIEGLKVIPTIYIVFMHAIFNSLILVKGLRSFFVGDSIVVPFVNVTPALFANTFFSLTGILTCYLVLKQNQKSPFIDQPDKWLALIAFRYMKLMPMYALIIAYTKYLSKFTGSGPFWDYGTSSLGYRRQCEQEPWLAVLTFTENFRLQPMRNCIPATWYISLDFQFFLITPIILIVLSKWQSLGRKLLIFGIIACFIGGIPAFLSIEADLRAVLEYKPHGAILYYDVLDFTYVRPIYRAPAYLGGLFIGSYLYQHDVETIERFKSKSKIDKSQWWDNLVRYGPMICLVSAIIVISAPVIFGSFTFSKYYAKIVLIFLVPIGHFSVAIFMGIYCMLATTGNGNKILDRFLASNFWKPLSRLSLSILFTNMETISWLNQNKLHPEHSGDLYFFSMAVTSIIVVYIIATVVCVLFESPVRSCLNKLVIHLMKQSTIKQKSISSKRSEHNSDIGSNSNKCLY